MLTAAVALPATFADGAADRTLDPILLTAQDVGPGYHRHLNAAGRRVDNQVTLDLCGFDFPSEQLRTGRVQMYYIRKRKNMQFSNEIVRYSGNGALQALGEVRNAATHCPRHRVRSNVRGIPPAKYRVKTFSGPGLEPDSLGILIHSDGRIHGKRMRFWNAAVYQVRGNVLSGTYTARKGANAQKRRSLKLAAINAAKLNANVP